MKITSVEPVVVKVNHRGDWIFVHVKTDEGIIGLGEASHSSDDPLVLAAIAHFASMLEGEDPTQIETIRRRLSRPDAGRIGHTALSAIEQALWDVLGQKLGVPVHVLLGGAMRNRLRLYANINRHVRDRSPEGFATAAKQAVADGYTAIKIAPFDELNEPNRVRTGPNAASLPGIERVRAVRAAIGDEIELAIDCHSRMEVSEAIQVGLALKSCNLFWYEEPVSFTQPDGLAQVGRAVQMPIASAESIYGIRGFRPFLERRCVDVLMPDVKHCGGILEMKEIAAAARLHEVLVAPHQPAGPVATAASAQAMATIPNFYILEHAWGEVAWRAQLLDPPEQVVDGHLLLSDRPGIGHRLNPEMVAAHQEAVDTNVDLSGQNIVVP
jgi:galactonate dehydratase